MLNLLMAPRKGRTVRGLIGTIADAVRSIVNPAALVADQAEPATVEAPDPAGLYTEADMPPVEQIERAALGYDLAADRAKRKHRKTLDRLPAGLYGSWLISRTPSSRQTVDLDKVRATYKRLGLGELPLKSSAPSLRVERVESVPAGIETLTEAMV